MFGLTLILAAVAALASRTVTQEEIFRELRDAARHWAADKNWLGKKLIYPLTCEYCFAHYTSAFTVWLMSFNIFDVESTKAYFISWLYLTAWSVLLLALFDHLKISTKAKREAVRMTEDAAKMNKELYAKQMDVIASAKNANDAAAAANLMRATGIRSVGNGTAS